jgi:hypothetical protein
MFIIMFYVVITMLTVYGILRLFLSKIKARTAIFFIFMFNLLYFTCFMAGILYTFALNTNDLEYWHSMPTSMSFFENYIAAGENFGWYLLAPYYFTVQFYITTMAIVITHFSVGFAISYTAGFITLFNWIRAAVYASRMRNPQKGFGDDMCIALLEGMKR